MKTLIALIGFGLLMVGCKPIPMKSSVPITGAFGYTLGSEIPDSGETSKKNDGSYSLDHLGDCEPFNFLMILAGPDRRINYISVSGADANGPGVIIIEQSLRSKYGAPKTSGEFTNLSMMWTDGSNTIRLHRSGEKEFLSYESGPLLDDAWKPKKNSEETAAQVTASKL